VLAVNARQVAQNRQPHFLSTDSCFQIDRDKITTLFRYEHRRRQPFSDALRRRIPQAVVEAYAGSLRGVAFNEKLPLAIVSSSDSCVAESSR
jgi:hypothetical protein